MNKLYTLLLMLLFLMGTTACTDESPVQGGRSTILPNGDLLLKMEAGTRGAPVITSRDIDPDGLVINSLWLLCFDEVQLQGGEKQHLYLGRRQATFDAVSPEPGNNYTFTVGVPQNTRVIHFVANLDMESFNAPVGISETTLVPSLESASGRMAYWGRKEFTSQQELEQFAQSGHVDLLYNQAKVSYKAEVQGVEVQGFAVCNRRAWGTLAPFDAKNGVFNFDLTTNPYITNPSEEHLILSPDPTEVSTAMEQYIFEDSNPLNEPVYAVMKIKTSDDEGKYYKIMLVDGGKDPLPIYRNYEYRITIRGIPTQFGYNTFEEAKRGVAANNVWVSVDPEVPELSDGLNTLNIPGGTTYIYTDGGDKTIDFSYVKSDGVAVGKDEIKVSWLENDGTVSSVAPELISQGEGKYTIVLTIANPLDRAAKATLLLRTGEFTRTIQVYLMKPLEFKPVWVTTGIPMRAGELIAMTFVIPDSYPEELFPVTCKIATNRLNPIDTLGVHYSVIAEDCTFKIGHESGSPLVHKTDWGYKYVYTATRVGEQEVFFRMNTSDGNDRPGTVEGCQEDPTVLHTHVFLQADYFRDEEKTIHFQEKIEETEPDRLIRFVGEPVDESGNVKTTGYIEKELAPTVGQEFTAPMYFTGGTVVKGTHMRISTVAMELLIESLDSRIAFEGTSPNGSGFDYWVVFKEDVGDVQNNPLNLKFRSRIPNVNDYVRFFIDGGDTGHPNREDKNWFKSGMIKVTANPGRFDFSLRMSQDVSYGIGQRVILDFTIPNEAVQKTGLKLYLLTKNLEHDPADPHYGHLKPLPGGIGYELNIPQGTSHVGTEGKLSFLTTRIASAETITLRTADDTQVLFNSFTGAFTNKPVKGMIRLSDGNELTTGAFIALERLNGTRIGVFRIVTEGSSADYELTVRPEYDFTMDESLKVYYHNLNTGEIYQTITTFNQLVGGDSNLELTR